MRKLEEFENFVSWEVVKPGRMTYLPDPEATNCWRVGSVQWVPWRRTCSGEGTLLLLHSHPAPRIPRKDIASYPLVLPRLDLVTHLNIYLRTTQKLIEYSLQKLPPSTVCYATFLQTLNSTLSSPKLSTHLPYPSYSSVGMVSLLPQNYASVK